MTLRKIAVLNPRIYSGAFKLEDPGTEAGIHKISNLSQVGHEAISTIVSRYILD